MKFNERVQRLNSIPVQTSASANKPKIITGYYELNLNSNGIQQQVVDPFNFNTQAVWKFFS